MPERVITRYVVALVFPVGIHLYAMTQFDRVAGRIPFLCDQFTGSGQSVDGVQLPLDLLATQARRRNPLVQALISFLQIKTIRVTMQRPGRFLSVFRTQAPARARFLEGGRLT
jgi:hypothetical protein